MPFAVRVFAVAVQCKRTDMQTVDTAVGQYAANVIRHIFQIPFVYKTVDLTWFLVALIVRIRIIYNADKTDTPDGKQTVDILFHQFQFTGKTWLCFAEDNIELVLFCVFQQPLKLRPPPVCTSIIIITVNLINFPPLFFCILHQHCFLILNAARIIGRT